MESNLEEFLQLISDPLLADLARKLLALQEQAVADPESQQESA